MSPDTPSLTWTQHQTWSTITESCCCKAGSQNAEAQGQQSSLLLSHSCALVSLLPIPLQRHYKHLRDSNKKGLGRSLIHMHKGTVSKILSQQKMMNLLSSVSFQPLNSPNPKQEGLSEPSPLLQRWEICIKRRNQRFLSELDVRAKTQPCRVLAESISSRDLCLRTGSKLSAHKSLTELDIIIKPPLCAL